MLQSGVQPQIVDDEVAQQLGAVRRMHHLGVEHGRVEAPPSSLATA